MWVDPPNGKTLRWTKLTLDDYSKKKKIWWASNLQQMNNNLFIVSIKGVEYPDYNPFMNTKAKIRFTPEGAIIEEWIK